MNTNLDTIYRIENESGSGPYGGGISWMTKEHNEYNGCPPPSFDFSTEDLEDFHGMDKIHRDLKVFGFDNMENLLSWFDKEEIYNLKNRGYYIKKMEGKILYKGKRQVVFVKKEYLNYLDN